MIDYEAEYGETILIATGDGSENYPTVLEVSGGSGNTDYPEIHLLIHSEDDEFAQGWFNFHDLVEALLKARKASG